MAGTISVSTVRNDTANPTQFQNSSGTEVGRLCRAWVYFNGSTGAIYAQFNVSSVTKTGTGTYDVNLTTALPDVNCSVVVGGDQYTAIKNGFMSTVSKAIVAGYTPNPGYYSDIPNFCVAVFR